MVVSSLESCDPSALVGDIIGVEEWFTRMLPRLPPRKVSNGVVGVPEDGIGKGCIGTVIRGCKCVGDTRLVGVRGPIMGDPPG